MNNSEFFNLSNHMSDDQIFSKHLPKKRKKSHALGQKKVQFGTLDFQTKIGGEFGDMSNLTVRAVAKAFIEFINQSYPSKKPRHILLGHDGRFNGQLFTNTIASVLSYENIKVSIMSDMEAVPIGMFSHVMRGGKYDWGLYVGVDHGKLNENGLKFFSHHGQNLQRNEIQRINELTLKIDPLKVAISNDLQVQIVEKQSHDEYYAALQTFKNFQELTEQTKPKIIFSTLKGSAQVGTTQILRNLNFEVLSVDKEQQLEAKDFSEKMLDPAHGKSYRRTLAKARHTKADVAFVFNSCASRLGMAVAHKRRFKFITGNDMAALALDFYLGHLKKNHALPSQGFILKSFQSGSLAAKIATSYGLKVFDFAGDTKAIDEFVTKHKTMNFVFAYTNDYQFIFAEQQQISFDALAMLKLLAIMTSHYKQLKTNCYAKLKSLYQTYGIHRTISLEKAMNHEMAHRFLKRMAHFKVFGEQRVVAIDDFRNPQTTNEPNNFVKIQLENDSWVAVEEKLASGSLKIDIEVVGTSSQALMDVVVREKEFLNIIDDNCESFEIKQFSWQTMLKYAIFIAIIMSILAIVFTKVYTSTPGKSVFENAAELFNRQSRWVWISAIFFQGFLIFLNALMRKRLIDFQGQKVKIRHLLISTIMGYFISYVTPFTIGGDAIGYWYLRRKGFNRGALLSSFITSTLIYQFGILLQSAILIPLGVPIYSQILWASSDPQSHAAFILFMIGISWNIFATFMIFSLTLSKSFQEFIVRNAIKVLEWMPFIIIFDPGRLASNYQYEFQEMRSGMRKIWKRKRLIIEVLCYELVPKFLAIYPLIFWSLGVIKTGLPLGSYWSQIVANDIIGTANSMSLTPGGSGTGEWLNVTVNEFIMVNGKDTASSLDFINKTITGWPLLGASLLMILTIILGERRVERYRLKNKNLSLQGKNHHHKTSFFVRASVLWMILIITLVCLFFFVLFK